MQPGSKIARLQFGVFELRMDTGELRKHGIRIRLQGKAFHLLQALLEQPGEVVTREELRNRLWPADTFVDFESGLNTAANRLRVALGDSAENPRYIETLSRNGYRFIAPLIELPTQGDLSISTTATVHTAPLIDEPPVRQRSRKWLIALLAMTASVALPVAWKLRPAVSKPVFHQITFRRITVGAARFTPDGQSVIYDARDLPGRRELYLANTMSPESRALSFPRTALAAVSRSGELALLPQDYRQDRRTYLVRVPMNGGAPMPVAPEVSGADWSPDASALAVLRSGVRPASVEFPPGKLLYRSVGWISNLRVSPSGKDVAFLDHPVRGDDAGMVRLVSTEGKTAVLSDNWASADGLAWAPSGKEVWFTAARTGVARCLYAVDLTGKTRLIAAIPGTLKLFDISHSGQVLIAREAMRLVMAGAIAEAKEEDLSWFDWSDVVAISDDGRVILFDETGEGGGPHHATYIRRSGASGASRISDGEAMALSPDGERAITRIVPGHFTLIPLRGGQSMSISGYGLNYDWVRFLPDGNTVLAGGNLGDGPLRIFTQPLDGGKPQTLQTDGYFINPVISPDGSRIAGFSTDRKLVIVPRSGGKLRALPIDMPLTPLRWSLDGKTLLAYVTGIPAKIFRVDVETGRYKPWKEVAPTDLVGITGIWRVAVSADEKSIVYSYNQDLSELFVVEGWR